MGVIKGREGGRDVFIQVNDHGRSMEALVTLPFIDNLVDIPARYTNYHHIIMNL